MSTHWRDETPPLLTRTLPDGRVLDLWRQFYNVRFTIGVNRDALCATDEWEYTDVGAAVVALATWDGDGEPDGWYRHKKTGRRRPDGDLAQEYIEA